MSEIPECVKEKYNSIFNIKYIGTIPEGDVYLSIIPISKSGGFVDIVRDNKIIETYANMSAIDFLYEKFPPTQD